MVISLSIPGVLCLKMLGWNYQHSLITSKTSHLTEKVELQPCETLWNLPSWNTWLKWVQTFLLKVKYRLLFGLFIWDDPSPSKSQLDLWKPHKSNSLQSNLVEAAHSHSHAFQGAEPDAAAKSYPAAVLKKTNYWRLFKPLLAELMWSRGLINPIKPF